MKVNITAGGRLLIFPESSVEAFALSKWSLQGQTITVIKEWPIPEPMREELERVIIK